MSTTLRVRSSGSAFFRNYIRELREDHAEAGKNLFNGQFALLTWVEPVSYLWSSIL